MNFSSLLLVLAPLLGASPAGQDKEVSAFGLALAAAERSLESGDLDGARGLIQRALERDPKAVAAWDLRARWAEGAEDRDDLVYALHRAYRLSLAQGAKKDELAARYERLVALDQIARDLYGLKETFIARLEPLAISYEKDGRPHAAIRVHKEILALDTEYEPSATAIERIASAPDPSLAGEAKPKDLFADVSAEWIREHDLQHGTWKERAKLERDGYVTHTDAGYAVLVQAAEAMEQMNAFYRVFFQYGAEGDGKNVPRIDLRIFKNKDEYLKLGSSPAEWSGGQFTGAAVETFVGQGGFPSMVGVLFHEAAHQFISLATNASGWLNEGLASFFEGTQLLPNGTVLMNMPAGHRLMPLARRMQTGWMDDHNDGIDPENVSQTPEKAPTFGIVLENRYTWGPPWYAPTWGVVFFLYNFQDPYDGRFVYRNAFREFVNKSGGRVGAGAISNFEEVVLANPEKPFKEPKDLDDNSEIEPEELRLPETVAELDPVWEEWITRLADEQTGRLDVERPYYRWGQFAAANGEFDAAVEHFEKGLTADPLNIDLRLAFADVLAKEFDNEDRAAALVLGAIQVLERSDEPDAKRLAKIEKLMKKLDPDRKSLNEVRDEMGQTARSIVQRYQAAGMPSMVMDVSWRLGSDFAFSDLYDYYEDALRSSKKSLHIWELAYNEVDLSGWAAQGTGDPAFTAKGALLESDFGTFAEDDFTYQALTLDRVTSGDFSIAADIQAIKGKVNFCGFAFGKKGATDMHGLVIFPGKTVQEGVAETGFVDLMSTFGGTPKTWRHVPVDLTPGEGESTAGEWHKLRLDVSGRSVDLWLDDELLATHEFASVDVLRGNIGLLTGVGKARYKDVRFLSRDPRDPAARIEREIRMEKLRAEGGGAVGGSYQGLVPPMPKVQKWVQGERTSLAEKGPVPQLLVFWSTDQNEIVAIDEWLTDLATYRSDVGLEIVSVCSPNDLEKVEAYLAEHPFPGAVGVDAREGVGIGESFEMFFIRRFNLPRLLLLDIDQTVAWEGDPGIVAGAGWNPDEGTFLDAPLDELISKRKLKELLPWRERWKLDALPALAAGDLETALPVLRQAEEFDRRFSPEARLAQDRLRAVAGALEAVVSTAGSLESQGRAPALESLLAWAPLFERTLSKKESKALKPVRSGDDVKDWAGALKATGRFVKRKKDEPAEKADVLIASLEKLEGAFVADLLSEVRAARESSDWDTLTTLVTEAESRPGVWLVKEFFGW